MKTQQPTNRSLKKAEEALNEYLSIGADIERLKKRQKELYEEELLPFAERYLGDDERIEIGEGYLRWQRGRAKLVDDRGKSVSASVRRLLVNKLPESFLKKDVEISAIEEALESGDKYVEKVLQEFRISLERGRILQIKALTPKKRI